MRTNTAEKSISPLVVFHPKKGASTLKNDVLSIRVNDQVMEYIESELAKLGVMSARERQDFYRGAILAALTNAKRANSPSWKKFIASIQPSAKKHLGMGLELDGPHEFMEAGGMV